MLHVLSCLTWFVPYVLSCRTCLVSYEPFCLTCLVSFVPSASCTLPSRAPWVSCLTWLPPFVRSLMFYELIFLMYPYATFNRCVTLLEGRMDIWFCYELSQKNGWKERYNLYYYLMVSTKMTSNIMYWRRLKNSNASLAIFYIFRHFD